ncbi:MAG: hypothetical protein V1831_03405 [Candidatus Woesearchaeota archaeon]
MGTLLDSVKNQDSEVFRKILRQLDPKKLPLEFLVFYEETCNFSDLQPLPTGLNTTEFDVDGTFYKEHEAQIKHPIGEFVLEGQPNKYKLNLMRGIIHSYQIHPPLHCPYERYKLSGHEHLEEPVFAIDRVYVHLEKGGYCLQTFTLNGRAEVDRFDKLKIFYAQLKLPEDSPLRNKGFESMLYLLIPKKIYIPCGK